MTLANKSPSPPSVIKLFDDDRGTPVQRIGLVVIPPGSYDTACGKGYWECKDGEPAKLVVTKPVLDFFTFESANSYFWWSDERKAFVQTWMSD